MSQVKNDIQFSRSADVDPKYMMVELFQLKMQKKWA